MKTLLTLLLLAASAFAQTATISDTIRTPFGGTFSGTVTVSLNSPALAQPLYSGSVTLSGWTQAVTVTAGVFTLTLYTNDLITPGGTSYTATYAPTSGSGWKETWIVPTGATTIREIRSTTVPSPSVRFTPSQITQAGATLGQGLKWDGSKWAPADVVANPMTTTGDLITRLGGVPVRVGIGSTNQVLTVSGGMPVWASGITGNASTASALAANGTNCSAGSYPLGVDASGNAEGCTAAVTASTGLSDSADIVRGASALTTVGSVPFVTSSGVLGQDAGLAWNSASKLLTINSPTGAGGTGLENLYKLRINMGTAPGYGLSIANGAIDPWFHVNSNGIGFIGDGTTIPFWSIEDEPNFVRELRAHVVPSGSYSFLWAKSSNLATKPNDLQLWANRDIVLQAGRSNSASDNNSRVIIQGSAGTTFTQWGQSGSNNSRTTIDYAGGARLYQYTSGGSLVNLLNAGGASYITSGNLLLGTTTDDGVNRLQVAGSVAVGGLSATNSSISITRTGSGASSLQVGAFNNKPTVIFNGTSGLAFETFTASLMNLSTAGMLYLYNETPTTGSTSLVVRAGAGQSGNIFSVRNGSNVEQFWVNSFGPEANNFIAVTRFRTNSNEVGIEATSGLDLASNRLIRYSSTTDYSGTKDLSLSRASANTLQVGDGSANSNGTILARIHTWANGTEGTCDATLRGQVVMVQGGAGVADTFRVCRKDSANAYAWTALY